MTIDEKSCELDLVRNSSRLLIHQLRELAVVAGDAEHIFENFELIKIKILSICMTSESVKEFDYVVDRSAGRHRNIHLFEEVVGVLFIQSVFGDYIVWETF